VCLKFTGVPGPPLLGIPRIDLALVSYRTRVSDTKPEVLNWNLPYEVIVVGVYE
jgi:hypothetical protein